MFFCRDGVSDAGEDPAVLVSAAHKPAAASELYAQIGACQSLNVQKTVNSIKVRRPNKGKYGLRCSLPVSQELALTAEMQDVNPITFESLFMVEGALAIGVAKQPMVQTKAITGWFKVDHYDQGKILIASSFLYGEYDVAALNAAESSYTHTLVITVLDNPLNSFEIEALTTNYAL